MLVPVQRVRVCDVMERRQARRETEIGMNQKLNDKSEMRAEMSSSRYAAERIDEQMSGRAKVDGFRLTIMSKIACPFIFPAQISGKRGEGESKPSKRLRSRGVATFTSDRSNLHWPSW